MNVTAEISLRRLLTFVVVSVIIVLIGVVSIEKTPTNTYPVVRTPVVAVVWTYAAPSPADISQRIVYRYERALTKTISNIEHIEGQSEYGTGIVKIFFQPGTDSAAAQAHVTSASQAVLRKMHADIAPPLVTSYNVSSVPVLFLRVSAPYMTTAHVYDMASNLILPAFLSLPAAYIPMPNGGASLDVEIDLDQAQLLSHGLSAANVAAALNRRDVLLTASDQKIGALNFVVRTNSTPEAISAVYDIPIRTMNGVTVHLRDVAYVHRCSPPQVNAVLVKSKRSVLIEILKSGNATTTSVVAEVKKALPGILRILPPGVSITPVNNASVFSRYSVRDVMQEIATAAILMGLIVLLFPGGQRSAILVAMSIPLAIPIVMAHMTGQSINVMTLGGLAVVVGILVDDVTVITENIDAYLERGGECVHRNIAATIRILIPTLAVTLSIGIVWLFLFKLHGISEYLFCSPAKAIVYAMIGAFMFSRTLVPLMAEWLLSGRASGDHDDADDGNEPGLFKHVRRRFCLCFTEFRESYKGLLINAVCNDKKYVLASFTCIVASLCLVPLLRHDFPANSKPGEIEVHIRAPIGTRPEDVSMIAVLVNQQIRTLLPGQVTNLVDNCGFQISGISQTYNVHGPLKPQDCDISISLRNVASHVDEYRFILRNELPTLFPGTKFSLLSVRIRSKVLDFG